MIVNYYILYSILALKIYRNIYIFNFIKIHFYKIKYLGTEVVNVLLYDNTIETTKGPLCLFYSFLTDYKTK